MTPDFMNNQQYVSSSGNWAYCYTELAVSTLAVAVTIVSTPCPYPRTDGRAEWACVGGYVAGIWGYRFPIFVHILVSGFNNFLHYRYIF